ncbi:MAG: hypothetical protein ABII82_16205 [Verrucomicrobiota bacterium]
MNTQRVTTVPLFAIAFGALLSSPLTLAAATWYLNAGQPSGADWDAIPFWSAAPDGSGGNPSLISEADTFDSNGKILRTPAQESYFGGASLVLSGSRLLMIQDADINGTLTTSAAGSVVTLASIKSRTLKVGTLKPVGNGICFWVDKAEATLTINVNKLTGDAPVTFGAPEKPGTVIFTADDASAFTGNLHVTGNATNVIFGNALDIAGTLVLDAGSSITLDQKLSFNAVNIAGADLPAGTYSFAQLNATHDTFFNEGGAGSIIVKGQRAPTPPAPSSP